MVNYFVNILSQGFHPGTAFLVIFIFSFVESIAFLGLVVPGSTITVIFGALKAHSRFFFPSLIIGAALGAFIGDTISFFLGKKGLEMIPVNKTEKKYFANGKNFFQKYGVWSLIPGRLFGPTRPIMPFVAGLFGLKTRRFLIMEMASAIIWSVVYLSVGRFLGFLIGPIRRSSHTTITLVLLLVVVLTVFYWYEKHLRQKNGG